MDYDFFQSNAWRLITFGMAATSGFAFIINRTRRQPDAQAANRQVAGWIMILASLAIAIGLGIRSFSSFGSLAGGVSVVLALVAAGFIVMIAGRD
ncbi:hypothetical protein [Desulfosarcina ovata]|uniref:hypothetical protein n=1 Tax=Desulfosarcina ovata TaxID=83564 RepID=UPI0015638D87|nr:hypothetical protein [Desulfosarcina ovata]